VRDLSAAATTATGAAVQAAEFGTEEARSIISAVIKSIAMYIQQVAAWLQSVISYVIKLAAQHPLAFMMFLTDVGILMWNPSA